MKVKSEVAQSCPTFSHPMQPTRLLHPWDFPGKSTGVGCHCLLRLFLRWIFLFHFFSRTDFCYFILVQLIYSCSNFYCTAKCFSYIHTFFFIFFSFVVSHRVSNIVPSAIQQYLLFIHSLYTNLYLLIPNSQSLPPPLLPSLGSQKSVLYIWESVSVSYLPANLDAFYLYSFGDKSLFLKFFSIGTVTLNNISMLTKHFCTNQNCHFKTLYCHLTVFLNTKYTKQSCREM